MTNSNKINKAAHLATLGTAKYPVAVKSEMVISGIKVTGLKLGDDLGVDASTVGELLGRHNESLVEWLSSNSPLAKPFKGMVFKKVVLEGDNKPRLMLPGAAVSAWITHWTTKKDKLAMAFSVANGAEVMQSRLRETFGLNQETEAVKDESHKSIRLWMVEQWVVDYAHNNKKDFHLKANETEKEIVFSRVTIDRLNESLARPTGYSIEDRERFMDSLDYQKEKLKTLMAI